MIFDIFQVKEYVNTKITIANFSIFHDCVNIHLSLIYICSRWKTQSKYKLYFIAYTFSEMHCISYTVYLFLVYKSEKVQSKYDRYRSASLFAAHDLLPVSLDYMNIEKFCKISFSI